MELNEKIINFIDLEYPGVNGNVNAIHISLTDVRLANSLLIEFSHDRDGWIISRPTKITWDANDNICDPCYKEYAFLPSWEYGECE